MKIVVEIQGDKIIVKFEGFVGDSCFVEANKLYEQLKKKGLKVELERVEPYADVSTSAVSTSMSRDHLWW